MKKFTKEEVCNILLSFNLKKYDDSEYLGANKSFYCINEEGYIAPVTLSNLQKGCPIRYFDKRNVYTIQNIKLFLSKYKPSVELTDGEYNGTHCKNLICRCTKPNCNYVWTTSWSALQKVNIENGGCKKCYGNIKRTMSDFHDMIDSRGGNIKILSEFYQNDKRVLHLLCMEDECKHDWVTTVAIFSSGSGCPKCARRKMSGVNSPVWNPLLTDEERVIKRQYSEYQNFIKESLIKNDFTCDISKQRGGQLEVHHLNGYHWYKEGRLDFNNIVVLSKDIHKEFHTLFGRGYNTIEQYIEFKNIKLDEMEKI